MLALISRLGLFINESADAELGAVNLHREAFHSEWNYSIKTQV